MDDSSLKSLSVTTAGSTTKLKLKPDFNRKCKLYSILVDSNVNTVTIKGIPWEADAFAQTQGTNKDGTNSLLYGETSCSVRVEAADKSFSLFSIIFYRPKESDIGLLEITGIPQGFNLLPAFSRFEVSYSLDVPPSTNEMQLDIITLNPKATIQRTAPSELYIGDSLFQFNVTAEDGKTTESYTICVHKENPGLERPRLINENQLCCSLCTSVLKFPRDTGFSCKHAFCRPCLQAFISTSQIEKDTKWECPLHENKDFFVTSNPLIKSDQEKEKTLFSQLCKCATCSIEVKYSNLLKHSSECKGSLTVICSECNQMMSSMVKHQEPCTFHCDACSKKVPNSDKEIHKTLCNRPINTGINPIISDFEKSNCSKKGAFSTEKVNQLIKDGIDTFSKAFDDIKMPRPDFASLTTAKELLCQAITQNLDQANLKKSLGDEKLQLQLAKVLDLIRLSHYYFPMSNSNEGGAKANSNDQAKDEFMTDEVTGLLLQLGIPPSASNEAQLKAMEMEYHNLKANGKINESEEVKGLIDWKMKQISGSNTSSSGFKGGYDPSIQSFDFILQKYKDATLMAQLSSDCYEEYLLALLEHGNHAETLQEAERSLSIHPAKSLIARVAYAVSFTLLKKDGQSPDLILEILEHAWSLLKSNQTLFGLVCKRNIVMFAVFEALQYAYCVSCKYHQALEVCKDLLFIIPGIICKFQKHSAPFRDTLAILLEVQQKAVLIRKVCQSDDFLSSMNSLSRNAIMAMEWVVVDSSELLESATLSSLALILILEPTHYNAYQLAKLKSKSSQLTALILAERVIRACLMEEKNEKIKGLLEKEDFYKVAEELLKSYTRAPVPIKAKLVGGVKGTAAPTKGKSPAIKNPAALPKSEQAEKKPAAAKNSAPKVAATSAKTSKAPVKAPAPAKKDDVSVVKLVESPVEKLATSAKDLWPGGKYALQSLLTEVLVKLMTLDAARKEELTKELNLLYKELLQQSPEDLEIVIEFGNMLLEQKNTKEAISVFTAFPFKDKPSHDELYLHSEIARLLMKEKEFKNPKLKISLIALGQNYGLKSIANYTDALDVSGSETVLLKEVFAGSNKMKVDDPDMVAFFKSKYWA